MIQALMQNLRTGGWLTAERTRGYSLILLAFYVLTGWEQIQSIFSAVRNLGGSTQLAYAAQGALMLALAASLVWLWRSRAAYDLKAAALAVACLLATPYVLDYDLMVVAIAIAFLAKHGFANGFRDHEISLLAAAWFVPLISRGVMGATAVPLGLLVLVALYVLILKRAAVEARALTIAARRLASA